MQFLRALDRNYVASSERLCASLAKTASPSHITADDARRCFVTESYLARFVSDGSSSVSGFSLLKATTIFCGVVLPGS